ncbi:MAG: ankyrin repeat domain-containing protein, partial [Candidatus Riflebacteria bacterium]|nr:ankyrin repeat domain-containing protein [Candidatus Riflebacteria bacterium]
MRKLLTCLLMLSISAMLSADPLNIAVRSLDIAMFKELIKNNPVNNATDSAGMTALHHACALGAVEMTEELLKLGADPKVCSNDGKNALHHAVNIEGLCLNPQPQEAGQTLCPLTIPLLLASAGLVINAVDGNGETALHIASRNGLVEVIATLLQAGANPDCLNRQGETPLHLAGGSLP